MLVHVYLGFPRLYGPDAGQHPQQLFRGRLAHQLSTGMCASTIARSLDAQTSADTSSLLAVRVEHVHNPAARSVRLPRGRRNLLLAGRPRVQQEATYPDHDGTRLQRSSRCVLSRPARASLPRPQPDPLFPVAVSLITCDLGLILELAGGFSATALAYLFRASAPHTIRSVSPRHSRSLCATCSRRLFPETLRHRRLARAATDSGLGLRCVRDSRDGAEYRLEYTEGAPGRVAQAVLACGNPNLHDVSPSV